MKKLSNKLSEAIIQALGDLELCMADPNYIIDFSDWHRGGTKECEVDQFGRSTPTLPCSVCFAGSVMAKSLGADIEKNVEPSTFSEEANMLLALDDIRKGCISDALEQLGIKEGPIKDVNVNQKDFDSFKQSMIEISEMLKAKGY